MVMTAEKREVKKQLLKLKRENYADLEKARAQLISEIETLRLEVGEPDQAKDIHNAWMAEMKTEGDDQC